MFEYFQAGQNAPCGRAEMLNDTMSDSDLDLQIPPSTEALKSRQSINPSRPVAPLKKGPKAVSPTVCRHLDGTAADSRVESRRDASRPK